MIKQLKNEFLKLTSFKSPITTRNTESYHQRLEQNLNLFTKKINDLNGSENNSIRIIKKHSKDLIKCNVIILSIVSSYLNGKSGEAFDNLELLFKQNIYSERLDNLVLSNSLMKSLFYRLRVSSDQHSIREDMFHIPLNKRYLVKNQRFSIAGVPSLYLGSSLYVAWLELGKPDFDKLWISGYQLKESVKIFDLAYDIPSLIGQLETNTISELEFVDKFLIWPFVMACSFQVKRTESSFKEEYIISSLFLQWITEKKKVDGLKYLSTKFVNYNYPQKALNFVFPLSEITNDRYFCKELERKFQLTTPLSWELLNMLPPVNVAISDYLEKPENLEDGLLKDYHISRFGFLEKQISLMEFKKIQNIKLS
jgi:hypothetical protein